MSRAFILMFDSLGVGAADDAEKFGDIGANTFGHIFEACQRNEADVEHLRQGPLALPNLYRLGFGELARHASHGEIKNLPEIKNIEGIHGYAQELSYGKDTPSGHWEIAGVPVLFDWGYFPPDYPSFPKKLLDDLIAQTGIPGVLGNKHASGTDVINELGDEHIKTGKPIVYTSADSVFQIACHEEHFGLERLYEICDVTRKLVDEYNIGRVIARPFAGTSGNYERTANRRDLSTQPPALTLLDKLVAQGGEVISIGKIADIYAHSGITKSVKGDGNLALFDALLEETKIAKENSLVFVNFVDFDSKYGHRRDVPGYANALEELDKRLPEFEALLKEDDIAIITADHGCDPTRPGSDHTREYIPIVAFGPKVKPKFIGKRETFADIGQSIADHLGLAALDYGVSFLQD